MRISQAYLKSIWIHHQVHLAIAQQSFLSSLPVLSFKLCARDQIYLLSPQMLVKQNLTAHLCLVWMTVKSKHQALAGITTGAKQ